MSRSLPSHYFLIKAFCQPVSAYSRVFADFRRSRKVCCTTLLIDCACCLRCCSLTNEFLMNSLTVAVEVFPHAHFLPALCINLCELYDGNSPFHPPGVRLGSRFFGIVGLSLGKFVFWPRTFVRKPDMQWGNAKCLLIKPMLCTCMDELTPYMYICN